MSSTAEARGPATDRKRELLDILARTAIAERSAPVSLRQFAIKAGVSEPTLRHYFTDRRGVVIAIIGHFAEGARAWLARSAEPAATLEASVKEYGALAMDGARSDFFAQAHAFAFVESIHDREVARAYLELIVEPSLTALEARLGPGVDPAGSNPERVRHGAIFLYAPVLVAVLHQRLLAGEDTRPLSMDRFFEDLTRLFTSGLTRPDET
ncbi:MAG: TetR/AcrR family transcriptional regulator [Oceanicaulis sp.]